MFFIVFYPEWFMLVIASCLVLAMCNVQSVQNLAESAALADVNLRYATCRCLFVEAWQVVSGLLHHFNYAVVVNLVLAVG